MPPGHAMPGGVANAPSGPAGPAVASPSPARAWMLGLGTVVLVFLYLGLGTTSLPLMDRDEPRFAEASREMLASGDWIVPRLNGEYRFDKPPVIYWLQAACIQWLGRTEAAVRLPSVLCAMLSAAATAAWAARMGSRRAGAWAASILLTCPQFYVHAHLAVADMAMILGFVVAGWCGWELLRPGRQTLLGDGWYWGWLAALAWGFLAKGPVAWLPVIPFAWARWQLARAVPPDIRLPGVRARDALAGIVVVLGLVGAWGIPALTQTQGEFWNVGMGKHVVARSVGVLEGHGIQGFLGYVGGLPFYLLAFPIGFLPWSPWLLQRLRVARPWRTSDVATRYVLGGAALVFVVFTLVRTKLPHYTLPAFPWIAAWLACELDRVGMDPRRFLRLAGVSALVLGLLAGIALPRASRIVIARDLQRVAAPLLQPRMAVATLGFQEPSIYWYLRPDDGPWVRHLQTEDDAARFLAQPGPRMVLVLGQLRAVASRLEGRFPDARTALAQGWNPVNGRIVAVHVIERRAAQGEP